MKEKDYNMEGFKDVSIKAGYFSAYKKDYKGADYFTINKNGWIYTIIQY